MGITVAFLVSLCFLLSVLALYVFIWSLGSESDTSNSISGANTIFDEGELGIGEDPIREASEVNSNLLLVGKQEDIVFRERADRSSQGPVLAFLTSALFWLVIGSMAGVVASLKLHWPDFLVSIPETTFGRIRPVHLNTVVYGWSSMAGIGVILWLLPRLLKTELVGNNYAIASAFVWNLGLFIGVIQLLSGFGDGKEFLEIHWTTDILFVIGGALTAVPLIRTLLNKNTHHIYVTVWYFSAAIVWLPVLLFLGNVPGLFHGAEQAILNWWFGHNVLGLWVTPIAVGTAYYFIPKILGRPINSYQLSLIGFWSLALFYSQVGVHHLLGGPVPLWLQTLSIVQSIMMFIPVLAFMTNMGAIIKNPWQVMKDSTTMRFILIGALMYGAASFQGSLEAIRSMNYLVHFTHYTVAHAHLGLYSFFTMIMFGAIYFIVPRLTGINWPYPKLINWHFWMVVIGMTIYIVGLTIGGVLQGYVLQDPEQPFSESTRVTLPYLQWRSFGGTLMTLGHFVIFAHFLVVLKAFSKSRSFQQDKEVTKPVSEVS